MLLILTNRAFNLWKTSLGNVKLKNAIYTTSTPFAAEPSQGLLLENSQLSLQASRLRLIVISVACRLALAASPSLFKVV